MRSTFASRAPLICGKRSPAHRCFTARTTTERNVRPLGARSHRVTVVCQRRTRTPDRPPALIPTFKRLLAVPVIKALPVLPAHLVNPDPMELTGSPDRMDLPVAMAHLDHGTLAVHHHAPAAPTLPLAHLDLPAVPATRARLETPDWIRMVVIADPTDPLVHPVVLVNPDPKVVPVPVVHLDRLCPDRPLLAHLELPDNLDKRVPPATPVPTAAPAIQAHLDPREISEIPVPLARPVAPVCPVPMVNVVPVVHATTAHHHELLPDTNKQSMMMAITNSVIIVNSIFKF